MWLERFGFTLRGVSNPDGLYVIEKTNHGVVSPIFLHEPNSAAGIRRAVLQLMAWVLIVEAGRLINPEADDATVAVFAGATQVANAPDTAPLPQTVDEDEQITWPEDLGA